MSPNLDLEGIDFDCGVPDYNDWLVKHASTAARSGSASVYLMFEAAQDGATSRLSRVVGYFTINPTSVAKVDAPKTVQGGLMRAAPGWMIGKLALDKSLRGQDPPLGPQLVLAALAQVVEAANRGGGQVIVVDADNADLIAFYERCGFLSTGVEGQLRLYMKVSTARRYLQP